MGAFWDHQTIQLMSGRKTRICHPSDLLPSVLTNFIAKISADPDSLPMLPQNDGLCPEADTSYGKGLLVIPGYTRKTALKRPEVYKKRKIFENALLQDAIRRGRPVLAICGGSWRLWTALGGGEFVTTNGHDYPLAHPKEDLRVSDRGEILGNKMAHAVCIEPESKLFGAMGGGREMSTLPVNSVHWQAPYEHECPSNVQISAKSKPFLKAKPSFFWWLLCKALSMIGLRLIEESVEPNTVEAFETRHGAPMIGVQWHPEAYAGGGSYAKLQQKLFTFMAESGESFHKKQAVLAEIKSLQKEDKLEQKKVVQRVGSPLSRDEEHHQPSHFVIQF
jgi:gamma-glutamyl-gamma-aminobutyrate hydrolase PuuD